MYWFIHVNKFLCLYVHARSHFTSKVVWMSLYYFMCSNLYMCCVWLWMLKSQPDENDVARCNVIALICRSIHTARSLIRRSFGRSFVYSFVRRFGRLPCCFLVSFNNILFCMWPFTCTELKYPEHTRIHRPKARFFLLLFYVYANTCWYDIGMHTNWLTDYVWVAVVVVVVVTQCIFRNFWIEIEGRSLYMCVFVSMGE